MKRFFVTTALAATLATGAVAATSGQKATIQNMLPTVNVEALAQDTLDEMVTVLRGGDSDAEKLAKLRALAAADNTFTAEPLTGVERARIEVIDPSVDFAAFTEIEISDMKAAIAAGDDDELRAIIEAADGDMISVPGFTTVEMEQIRNYDADVDFSEIEGVEITEIRTALKAGEDTAIRAAIDAAQS